MDWENDVAKKRELARLRCFVAIPFHKRFATVRKAVSAAIADAGFLPVVFDEPPRMARSIRETLMAELAQALSLIHI